VAAAISSVDLNSDLGEGYGPYAIGDDAAMLSLVSSANIACGGHASDPDTMDRILSLARERGVVVGAHPGYPDRLNFGRRDLPYTPAEITRFTAAQIGALIAMARLAGTEVRYVKPHGALNNRACDDAGISDAIVAAVAAIDRNLAVLAVSGTELETAARRHGLPVYSEIFADRGYTPAGRLVPRGTPGDLIHDEATAVSRLLGFLDSGRMPTIGGAPIPLAVHSICIHGDNPGAVRLARALRSALEANGIAIRSFLT
jgi:5-oxoprolinase (ATP-hydrolysing) subunit A